MTDTGIKVDAEWLFREKVSGSNLPDSVLSLDGLLVASCVIIDSFEARVDRITLIAVFISEPSLS